MRRLQGRMDATVIGTTIKQSIARVTGIPPDQISDTASYSDDLGLESLAMLEIAVDAEMCFNVRAAEGDDVQHAPAAWPYSALNELVSTWNS